METKKRKVLVVDDECVIADTLAIILNQHGFDAIAVYTGTGAVEQARAIKPDLIISDVSCRTWTALKLRSRFGVFCRSARFCCFPGRQPRPICWRAHAREATS